MAENAVGVASFLHNLWPLFTADLTSQADALFHPTDAMLNRQSIHFSWNAANMV